MILAEVHKTPRVLPREAANRAADGLQPIPRRVLEVVPPIVAWIALTSPAWAAIVAPELLG